MAFAQPSSPSGGDNFNANDHKGALLIVYPKQFLQGIVTTKGLSDAADVDIIVVDKRDETGKPLSFHGARLFGNLARSVRNDIGGQVLGRLNQITSANGNTPWILENFTDQDQAAADPIDTAYRQGHFAPTQNPMQAPAPPAAAPAQQWQGAPAPAPAAPAVSAPTATAATWNSPAPTQQWQAPPVQAAPAPTPAAAPAPQWSPGPATAPAPAQQWQAPAPPASAVAAPAVIDPGLLAFLASRGINGPFPDQATAEAIAATLPQ